LRRIEDNNFTSGDYAIDYREIKKIFGVSIKLLITDAATDAKLSGLSICFL